MPLLDRQRRGVVLGAIRIGVRVQATSAQGRTFLKPEKLSTFRLTSPDKHKISAAAELYGGEVKPWKPDERTGQQWEVVTLVDRMPVRIPPGEPVTQAYELWSGTRQRLCDGITERMKGGTCVCPPDLLERKRLASEGGACKPVTRLSLVLADLPGLGVWSLTSTGDSAADELAAVAEAIHRSDAAGILLPATLRLEPRESRGSGQVHKYAVPVLDVGASLVALEAGQIPQAELAVPVRQAITAAAPDVVEGEVAPTPPAPSTAPRSAQDVADRSAGADADLIRRLRAFAQEQGWLETFVADADGVEEPLENLLYARLEAAGGLG